MLANSSSLSCGGNWESLVVCAVLAVVTLLIACLILTDDRRLSCLIFF